MFGFFRKKPTKADAVAYCEALIRKASIDVVLDQGNYVGFLVRVAADSAALADHFKFPEAWAAMISAVEHRIANRQYDDPGDGIIMVRDVRELSGWEPDTNVPRAVFGKGDKPLFRWSPQPSA